MRRSTCSACGAKDLEIFLDLGSSPVADAYVSDVDLALASPRYPLQVATCPKCRLVQLLEVLDPGLLFGSGYHFYSSASPPLSSYHARYAQAIIDRHRDLLRHGVIEIGCNDGDMLRHFHGYPHLGVDPAHGPVSQAEERGLRVLDVPFSYELARGAIGRRYGIVIANHVLAHVADVSDFLAGVAAVLRPDGLAFIEVQYLPDLLVNNTFDLVYHEHRNFFSLTTLESALARHGLHIIDAELTDRQGGSLRVTAAHAETYAARPEVERLYESEVWLSSFGAYEGMQGRAERIRERLGQLLSEQPGTVALYGAPAKATTLLSFCGLGRDQIAYCWDSTKAKQGRYIPGTAVHIHKPGTKDDRPFTFLLAAWNYLRPITRANPRFNWIVPFPAPMEL